MFANTLTITIDGAAKVLNRVNQDNFGSTYTMKDTTGAMTLQFRNSQEKGTLGPVDRHNMFFEHRVYPTPTVAGKLYTASTVFRMADGSDPVYLQKLATGFITLLSAQKDGLINGES
jgi:hypothetical protein